MRPPRRARPRSRPRAAPRAARRRLGRLAVEQRRRRARRGRPSCRAARRLRPRASGSSRERALEQRDEVDRVPPGVRLLHPLGEGELRRQRPEHRLGALPAGDVERLERLVDEVERVPAVEVAVVGRGGEEHVRELARRRARRGRPRRARARRPRRRAPRRSCRNQSREPRRLGRRPGSGSSGKRGGLLAESDGDVGEPVVERRRPLGGRRAAATRFIEAGRASSGRGTSPRRGARRRSRARRGRRRAPLGSASSSAIVAFASTSGMSRSSPSRSRLRWWRDRIVARAQVDEDVVAVQRDREAAQLVGELVERAAGRQVEARVVPVAREDPVADRARDGAGSPCADSGCRPRTPPRLRRTGRACAGRGGRRAGLRRAAPRATQRGRHDLLR